MAGDWIKMRGNLWDDPRVAHICDTTEQGEATVVGALYWLWATADQHTESGILPGLTLKAINRKTGVQGFAEALCEVGWLEQVPEGVRIVRFEEHNGTSAKSRAMDAKRKADSRKVSGSEPDNERTEDGQIPPKSGAREEKSREERKEPPIPQGGSDGFEDFWNAWPAHERKVAKKQCQAKWGTKGCAEFADKVVAHVEAMKRSAKWQESGGQFIPAPLVYLNQERWTAAPSEAPSLTTGPTETVEQYQARMAAEREAERGRATKPPLELLARRGIKTTEAA